MVNIFRIIWTLIWFVYFFYVVWFEPLFADETCFNFRRMGASGTVTICSMGLISSLFMRSSSKCLRTCNKPGRVNKRFYFECFTIRTSPKNILIWALATLCPTQDLAPKAYGIVA